MSTGAPEPAQLPSTMRTWRYSTVQGPLEDSLVREDAVPLPDVSSLTEDQLLVQVISAALNPVDYKLPESSFGRLLIGRPATPGLDFCGRVAAKHRSSSSTHDFQEDQLVFGGLARASAFGTLGEYIIVSSRQCAKVPKGVKPDEAAAVGTAATSALQSLPPENVTAGSHVFINGGSGGVGTWAIQFAKAMGAANVVATCSGANIELCRSLGADEVLDYTATSVPSDLKARGQVFDVVADNVFSSPELYNNANLFLKPGGLFVQVGVGHGVTAKGVAASLARRFGPAFGNVARRFHFVEMKNSSDLFGQIATWMEQGKARAVVGETYAWDQVPEAFRKLRQGHAKGKIVVHVQEQN